MKMNNKLIRKILLFLLLNPVFLFSKSLVLFSPEDKITEKLIRFINESKSRIYAAVYMLTDKKIADALIKAKNERGIDVQVITDQSCLESKFNKVDFLKENGIEIFIFRSNRIKNTNKLEKIMHNKFALFDNNVWTGSFNWTVSANKKNQENVVCLDDENIYKKYEGQFEKLKKRCIKQKPLKFAKNIQNIKNEKTNNIKRYDFNGLKGKITDLLKYLRDKFNDKFNNKT